MMKRKGTKRNNQNDSNANSGSSTAINIHNGGSNNGISTSNGSSPIMPSSTSDGSSPIMQGSTSGSSSGSHTNSNNSSSNAISSLGIATHPFLDNLNEDNDKVIAQQDAELQRIAQIVQHASDRLD